MIEVLKEEINKNLKESQKHISKQNLEEINKPLLKKSKKKQASKFREETKLFKNRKWK